MPTLTKRQKQALDFIRDFVREYGFAPSYEEIGRGLGISSQSTVHEHVENLQKKGYLIKRWNANRSIDLTEATLERSTAMEVPLAGRIAAGKPIEAVTSSDSIAIPPQMLGRQETYVLQVKGDSMVDDHVVDGDYVVVEKRAAAQDGEMVVALIKGEEATLKRFRFARGQVRLEPANPRYEPMIYDPEDVEIQGIVIGILRKYTR